MYTKLTLRLNKSIVDTAKEHVAKQGLSLSRMVESYFLLFSQTADKTLDNNEIKISPFVQSMTIDKQIPPDLDYKSEYKNYLSKKYE
jgi:hypothetical protein